MNTQQLGVLLLSNEAVRWQLRAVVAQARGHASKASDFQDGSDRLSQQSFEIFSQENFEFQKLALIGSVAKTWGIALHRATPDFEALAKLLNTRYNNSTDDIDHENFFSGV